MLFIDISDNGNGMSEEKIHTVLQGAESDKNTFLRSIFFKNPLIVFPGPISMNVSTPSRISSSMLSLQRTGEEICRARSSLIFVLSVTGSASVLEM